MIKGLICNLFISFFIVKKYQVLKKKIDSGLMGFIWISTMRVEQPAPPNFSTPPLSSNPSISLDVDNYIFT
jgi:hypothetical protein